MKQTLTNMNLDEFTEYYKNIDPDLHFILPNCYEDYYSYLKVYTDKFNKDLIPFFGESVEFIQILVHTLMVIITDKKEKIIPALGVHNFECAWKDENYIKFYPKMNSVIIKNPIRIFYKDGMITEIDTEKITLTRKENIDNEIEYN